jgi:hypothetical protein
VYPGHALKREAAIAVPHFCQPAFMTLLPLRLRLLLPVLVLLLQPACCVQASCTAAFQIRNDSDLAQDAMQCTSLPGLIIFWQGTRSLSLSFPNLAKINGHLTLSAQTGQIISDISFPVLEAVTGNTRLTCNRMGSIIFRRLVATSSIHIESSGKVDYLYFNTNGLNGLVVTNGVTVALQADSSIQGLHFGALQFVGGDLSLTQQGSSILTNVTVNKRAVEDLPGTSLTVAGNLAVSISAAGVLGAMRVYNLLTVFGETQVVVTGSDARLDSLAIFGMQDSMQLLSNFSVATVSGGTIGSLRINSLASLWSRPSFSSTGISAFIINDIPVTGVDTLSRCGFNGMDRTTGCVCFPGWSSGTCSTQEVDTIYACGGTDEVLNGLYNDLGATVPAYARDAVTMDLKKDADGQYWAFSLAGVEILVTPQLPQQLANGAVCCRSICLSVLFCIVLLVCCCTVCVCVLCCFSVCLVFSFVCVFCCCCVCICVYADICVYVC